MLPRFAWRYQKLIVDPRAARSRGSVSEECSVTSAFLDGTVAQENIEEVPGIPHNLVGHSSIADVIPRNFKLTKRPVVKQIRSAQLPGAKRAPIFLRLHSASRKVTQSLLRPLCRNAPFLSRTRVGIGRTLSSPRPGWVNPVTEPDSEALAPEIGEPERSFFRHQHLRRRSPQPTDVRSRLS